MYAVWQKGIGGTMKAYLILEDGSVWQGESVGASGTAVSEIVFNTSMTGYLEVLTDPSYAGQSVVMTYPLIGNYGETPDMESKRAWPKALIVRELSRTSSNFRRTGELSDFLISQNVIGISGLDTRALTKKLRECGTMNGMITTQKEWSDQHMKAMEKIRSYSVGDVVEETTCRKAYTLLPENGEGKMSRRVALLDLGAKDNIARSLQKRGCTVDIYPSWTTAKEILSGNPDGIMLSNGPGDPAQCVGVIRQIRKLYESSVPVFAICLGHQLMALATGAKTKKLKYGHRGGNHPVRDISTGRVYISSQNHGYVVDTDSLDPSVAVPAFVNVNDGTNEGLAYTGKNIFTVQFHPEASPGPKDLDFLFDRFMDMMDGGKEDFNA